MQSQSADPHDAIAAQLRDLTPRRARDSSGLNDTSKDTSAASPEPAREPSFRAGPLNDNMNDMGLPASRGRSGRGVVLLAVCVGVAATIAWHSYGDEAKQGLWHLVPRLLAFVPAMQGTPAVGPKDAAPQTVASQQAAAPAPAQPAPAQEASNAGPITSTAPAPATAVAETPPAQVALPPELMQSIEAMKGEIESLKQTVDQLQAGQQQLSRDIAKAGERGTHHKVTGQTSKPASPPRQRRASTPAAVSRNPARYSPPPVRSQVRTYPQSPAQRDAYIPPRAPTQLPPPPGDSGVPRPPMPLQ